MNKTHCPSYNLWFGSWLQKMFVAVLPVSDPLLHICEGRAYIQKWRLYTVDIKMIKQSMLLFEEDSALSRSHCGFGN